MGRGGALLERGSVTPRLSLDHSGRRSTRAHITWNTGDQGWKRDRACSARKQRSHKSIGEHDETSADETFAREKAIVELLRGFEQVVS
jgi:hypothetical protein